MNSFRYDLALARMLREGEEWCERMAAGERPPSNDAALSEARRVYRREERRERKRRRKSL